MKTQKLTTSKKPLFNIPDELKEQVEKRTLDPARFIVSPYHSVDLKIHVLETFFEPYSENPLLMKSVYRELLDVIKELLKKGGISDTFYYLTVEIGEEEREFNRTLNSLLSTYDSRMKNFGMLQIFFERQIKELEKRSDVVFQTELTESEFLTFIEILMQKKLIKSSGYTYKQLITKLRSLIKYSSPNQENKISYLETILQGNSAINQVTIKAMKESLPSIAEIKGSRKSRN